MVDSHKDNEVEKSVDGEGHKSVDSVNDIDMFDDDDLFTGLEDHENSAKHSGVVKESS